MVKLIPEQSTATNNDDEKRKQSEATERAVERPFAQAGRESARKNVGRIT
jgi:hypothetical protein